MNNFMIVMASIILCVVAMSLSFLGVNWLQGVSKNPDAAEKMFVPAIIILATIEIASLIAMVMIFS